MTSSRLLRGSILLVIAPLVLTACVVAPVGQPVATYPAYSGGYAETVVVAPVAPPTPYPEVIPVAPFVGAVWVAGYWNWHNHRHIWVPGRYVQPHAGHHWRPHRWERGHGGNWRLQGGHWHR